MNFHIISEEYKETHFKIDLDFQSDKVSHGVTKEFRLIFLYPHSPSLLYISHIILLITPCITCFQTEYHHTVSDKIIKNFESIILD